MKWRQRWGRGECFKEKRKVREDACMGKEKDMYIQYTHRWMRGWPERWWKIMSKNKNQRRLRGWVWVWREVQFLLILEFWFFSLFPQFCQFLSSRPSFLSLSPSGPPSPLFPLLFFLPVPVLFLLPLSLSLSLSFSLSTADRALHFPLILCLCPLHVSIHRTLVPSTLSSRFRIQFRFSKKVSTEKSSSDLKKRPKKYCRRIFKKNCSVKRFLAVSQTQGQSTACIFQGRHA